MTTAWRHCWIVGLMALAGCGPSEPVLFSHDERLTGPEFAEKPKARQAVESIIDTMYGDSPYRLRVPEGAGLPEGGRYLAGLSREPNDEGEPGEPLPVVYYPAGSAQPVRLEGGQSLYHRHCLHCHGISGDGEGPTAAFLYPRPRDYRRGLFKFTSTTENNKITRDDLRRTIEQGIDGTSMPAFHAQMTGAEIEQVIDYVIFLSMRGETERLAIEEAFGLDEDQFDEPEDLELFEMDIRDFSGTDILSKWNQSLEEEDEVVVRPKTPRVPPTDESIARGRELFLGISRDVKLACVDCHGPRADGNGSTWIDPETFNRYVFVENHDPTDPSTIEHLAEIAGEELKWADEWGDPLRPANLNRGVYKGGRRPIDIYWRIATGIPGSGMPEHASTLQDPDDLWHLVNFVLALPSQPELLRPDQLRRLGVNEIPDPDATASR